MTIACSVSTHFLVIPSSMSLVAVGNVHGPLHGAGTTNHSKRAVDQLEVREQYTGPI